MNMNESITTVLTRLGKEEVRVLASAVITRISDGVFLKAALGNRWPSISLMKASRLISKLPFKLTSGSQASVYKGIGDKSKNLISGHFFNLRFFLISFSQLKRKSMK